MTYKSEDFEMLTYVNGYSVNLPVDIYFDTEGVFNPLCVYFRNGYEKTINEWLPIKVSNNPHLLGNINDDLNITYADYLEVENFVYKYHEELILVAKEEKCLYNDILFKIEEQALNENKTLINEMAVLRPNQTGLKNKIWIDTGETFRQGGHWLRLKIQTNNDNNSHHWATLTIPEYKWIGGEEINSSDKKIIEKYASSNVAFLTSVLLGKMDIKDYINNSYKINKDGIPVKSKEQKEWVRAFSAGYGISIYKRNISPYMYMYSIDGVNSLFNDENNNPLYFPNAHPFDKNGKAYVPYNGEWLLIKSNGDYAYV